MKKIIISLIVLSSSILIAHEPTAIRKPVRVYVDMVADLFHGGHINFLRQARAFGDYLIVGLCSDQDVLSYKRLPILTLEERAALLKECKLVDQVIAPCPLIITEQFIEEHAIDIVVHGSDFNESDLEKYYGVPRRKGIFKIVPYTPGISTSEILRRIKNRLLDGTLIIK